jgi:hypothetical protein
LFPLFQKSIGQTIADYGKIGASEHPRPENPPGLDTPGGAARSRQNYYTSLFNALQPFYSFIFGCNAYLFMLSNAEVG